MTQLTWTDIFVDASNLDCAALFEQWQNTVRGKVAPIGASAFGDLFFQREDGVVYRLDVLEGGVTPVAPTFDAFASCMNDPAWQERQLLTGGVALLMERGVTRESGQFYAFAPHPSLVGEVNWQRVMALDAIVWHSICSQLLDEAA